MEGITVERPLRSPKGPWNPLDQTNGGQASAFSSGIYFYKLQADSSKKRSGCYWLNKEIMFHGIPLYRCISKQSVITIIMRRFI